MCVQDQEVQVQYLCCPGSADDMIWSIVNAKLRVVGATLDGHTAGTAAGAVAPPLMSHAPSRTACNALCVQSGAHATACLSSCMLCH